MVRRCAFLTMEDPTGFFVYDHLAHEPLRKVGWEVVNVPWSRPAVDWRSFDAVVIRSPWDYQHSPGKFLTTLRGIHAAGTRLFNPEPICRWNLDKTYLQDLSDRGVTIVPTKWLDHLDENRMAALLMNRQTHERIVIKPTVGAGADGIHVVSTETPERQAAAIKHYTSRPLMVQSFLNSIQTIGEYSLFYFGGKYSHAILKQPKLGDFRVQEEHGGMIQAVQPDDKLLRTAESALAVIDQTLLYARIDIVLLDDETPAVIELELVEPSLYFPYDDGSPTRFAHALHRMWKQPHAN